MMKKSTIYIIAALALVLSCTRPEPGTVEYGDLIRISATGSDVATKGFLNKNDIQADGTEVKIFDDITGFVGTINNVNYDGQTPVTYINENIVCDGTNWSFGTPWRWTRTGVHHFYGWLEKDKDGKTPASLGVTPTLSGKVLSIPAITFTKDTEQFDFQYSDIKSVDVENSAFNAASSVEIPLNHLFSAIAVTIQNNGESDVNIVSVTLDYFNNTKSATIDYTDISAAKPVVTPTVATPTPGTATQMIPELEAPVPLPMGGTKLDLMTGNIIGSTTRGSYYMVWPQSAAEINPTVSSGIEAPAFTVRYTYNGIYDDPSAPGEDPQLHVYEATCNLKSAVSAIKAGNKYAINLQFKGKSIDLGVVVMPWEAQYFDLDYSTNTIQAMPTANNEGVLWLYTWDYDELIGKNRWFPGARDRKITMDSGKQIKGDFTILSPTSGQWQITTYPAEASQYFTIEPSSGDIADLVDEYGNFTGYVEFLITCPAGVPTVQHLHFNVDIQISGVWRNANTEFNRKDWDMTRLP
ncbi:MAG: fimbrillin family protein [Bacteroidales bacterium]|nr:fimbrillin family protein [Bacteroidales bacterium]